MNELAENLMKDLVLTRKHCVSKVAEIYDPEGLWEPIKLEFKLELAKLNDVDWDQPIPDELQVTWKQRLLKLMDLPNIKIDRSVIPDDENIHLTKARLLVLVDAAEHAGGAAVYIGYKLSSGNYSCRLLTSKSRILHGTIPRNELSALLLGTELAFTVCKALSDIQFEVIFLGGYKMRAFSGIRGSVYDSWIKFYS